MAKKTILVIENDPTLQKLNKEIFLCEGYRVLTANNGALGLALLEKQMADLVVTDILMPEMDGYTLTYNIRKNKKLKHIPIIIYTATYTTDIDEAIAIGAGANVFIHKPASIADLLNAAKKLLTLPGKNAIKISLPKVYLKLSEFFTSL